MRLYLLSLLLVASVTAQSDDDDCGGCSASSTTLAAGDLKIGRRRWQCINKEDVEMVDTCTGADGSYLHFAMVPGRRPNITRVCENEKGCKFDVKWTNISMTCTSGGENPRDVTKAMPLVVGCKCGKCYKKPDCGCTATTRNYGVGEYTFGKSRLKEKCSNMEVMTDVVERCEGEDGSFSQLNLVEDQYPNITRSCDEDLGIGCGFEKERRETKVICTKDDGTSEEQYKRIPIPVGCKCRRCRKRGGRRPGGGGRRPGSHGGRPGGFGGGRGGGRGGNRGGRGRGGNRG